MENRVGIARTAVFRAILAIVALCLPAVYAQAQAPANPPKDQPRQPTPQQPAPQKPSDTNPFPEDTNNVPVIPSGNQPAAPSAAPEAAVPPLPSSDVDPVRSPDEAPSYTSSSESGDSSSSADLASILAPPPDEETRKDKKARDLSEPEHKETAKEDESVGQYYLGQKNWRAALSRYQSALVLDPENPDVYWGLAESQRHLGDLANAKFNYQKVLEYDPDSRHAKEAKKLLQDPEMANAPAAPAPHP